MGKTVLVRYLGAKGVRHVDLPIGALSRSEITGTVTCNPVGEFSVEEAKKLFQIAGASEMFVYEEEYQWAHAPKKKIHAEPAPRKEMSPAKKAAVEKMRAARRAKSQTPPAPEIEGTGGELSPAV